MSTPELHNIPIRTELGAKIKEAFTKKSEVLLTIDFSKIEERIIQELLANES